MQMCAKCKKRVAVLFITRNEGLCLKCAKDLGIKPVNDILDKMGLTESDFDRLNTDMENFMGIILAAPEEDNEEGGAPAIDFSKLIRESGLMGSSKSWQKSERETQQQKPKRKFLSTYCKYITRMAAEGRWTALSGEAELCAFFRSYGRRQKNTLLWVSPASEKRLSRSISQRMGSGNVPYKLRARKFILVTWPLLLRVPFRGHLRQVWGSFRG